MPRPPAYDNRIAALIRPRNFMTSHNALEIAMRRLLLLPCVFAIAAVALPPAVDAGDFDMSQIYSIDSGHSYLGFQVKYMGFAKVRGRMTDFSGTIRFDETDLTRTSKSPLSTGWWRPT